jgi:Cu-Zn family superoxide dismutase
MRIIGRAATTAALALPFALVPGTALAGAAHVNAAGAMTRYPLIVDGTDTNPVLPGATARVHAVLTPSGKTIVTLVVDGFAPDRELGSHVHQKPCGATGADAGGHYQNVPSTDPAAGNPANEVWLDFATDADGHGEATAVVDWQPKQDGAHPFGASSVVVHRDETAPGGAAGPRLACLTVPFTG